MTGKLITLEGGEGAGKSTVLAMLCETLVARGIDVAVTREPGGTAVGEALRAVLLDPQFRGLCAESELLLMFASRAQLVREVIQPALAAGRWVLSDRFTDASFAYQGGGRGLPLARIAELQEWAVVGVQPDLTLLLDLPVSQGLARISNRGEQDRIEMENILFFEKVRKTYRDRAVLEPERFRVIDAAQPLDEVLAKTHAIVNAYLDQEAITK